MRVLICGDRNWVDEGTIEDYIKALPPGSIVIQGFCKGADKIARRLAQKHGYSILDFPAKWNRYGRGAGPIRNKQMLDEGKPDLVVAFHNDLSRSKGTADMIKQARKQSIPVEVRGSDK